MNAKKIIEQVLTEMPMDTGGHQDFIHPEKKQKFAARSHPMAKNPAYPEHTPQPGQKESNWEEVVASKQYQDTMARIKDFFGRLYGGEGELEFQTVFGALFQGVQDAMEMERPYRRALEKLAIQLLFEQPEFASLKEPYEKGEFKIDARLGVPGDLANAKVSDAEEQFARPEIELQAAEEFKGELTPEILKRKVINAMIAGGAVSKNYAYQLYNTKLTKISPGLPTLYGFVMACTELGYFATSDEHVRASVTGGDDTHGGSAEMDTEGEVPVIKVRAMIFPMLVQELTKGLLELVSYEGLPKDSGRAKEVIDKADLADEEAWAMIMGRGLWMRFVNAIGADADDVTLNLYNYLVQLEPNDFNATMKTIQKGGPEAEKLLKDLVDKIRRDIEDEKHGDYKEGGEEQPPGGGPEGEGEFGYGGDSWKQ